MAQTSLIIGDTNWAVKEDSLLGYNVIQNNYLPIPIDCVRATTATRVNEQGLIEIVPRNLIQQSSTFNVGPWVNSGVTLTSGFTDVNGGSNAFRFQCPATNSFIYNTTSATTGAQYTHSVYVRAVSGTQTIKVEDAYAGGTVNTTVTTEWQRITLTFTSTVNEVGILIYNNPSTAVDIYICFAQTEQGSVATEYFPTTNRLDIPRIDYSTGTASLLVEPQRTNLYFPSIPNSSGSGTYILNDAISPDGTQNASSFVPSGFGVVFANAISTTVQTYTFSVYLKGTVNGQKVGLGDNGVVLNNFTITTSWQRYTFTFTGSVQNTPFYLLSGNYFAPAENNKFYIYGAQLEVGSYATSYIPTIASSVTRNADLISKTGVSGLIGQTEGTIFVDFNLSTIGSSTGSGIIELTPAGGSEGESNRIIVYKGSLSKEIGFQIRAGGTTNIFNYLFSAPPNGKVKIGIAYKSGDTALSVNGVIVQRSETFTFSQTLNFIKLGASLAINVIMEDSINSVQLYKTRLTNSELASLTTI